VDIGHSVEPRAVGDIGVAYLVAFPLNSLLLRGRVVVCCGTELAPQIGGPLEIPRDPASVGSLL